MTTNQIATIQAELRDLAEIKPGPEPFISLYLDMRTDGNGTRPAATFLRTTLERQSRLFGEHGAALTSFLADRVRIEHYVEQEFDESLQGLALFACNARGIFVAVKLAVTPKPQLTVTQAPRLFQLARLLDDYTTYCVAVVSRTRARVFTVALGSLQIEEELTRSAHHVSKTSTGGWSEGSYQRHVENNIKAFETDVAAAIRKVWDEYTPAGLVLAGEVVGVTALKTALDADIAAGIISVETFAADIPRHQLLAEILPIVQQAERAEETDAVQELDGAGELGVLGIEPTLVALQQGQVDQLLLSSEFAGQGWRCQECLSYGAGQIPSRCPYCKAAVVAADLRESMVGAAERTGALLEFVRPGTSLDDADGVGALLRYPM